MVKATNLEVRRNGYGAYEVWGYIGHGKDKKFCSLAWDLNTEAEAAQWILDNTGETWTPQEI